MTHKRGLFDTIERIMDPSTERDRHARELLFLEDASTALLETVDLDQILYTVLTAITLGEGLGFNRAMVFLFDRRNQTLKGEMAVGPDNPTEAQRIWTALTTKPGRRLRDMIGHVEKRSEVSHLNAWVRQMNIPTDGSPCLFERTFREGRSFVLRTRDGSEEDGSPVCLIDGHPTTSPACEIHCRMTPRDDSYDWASVPLWGKGRVIGTISVDNIFNRNPIKKQDLRLLEIFTKQVGLAVEHAMVINGAELSNQELRKGQEVLIEREKTAALQQMAANVAHAIRNPLVSIGGFARRLDQTLDPNAPARKHAQTIIKETTRLEGILEGILDYSAEMKPRFGMHDFNEIIGNALDHLTETRRDTDILVDQNLEPSLPEICCDDKQIRQVVLNILFNAVDAMNGHGKLSVKSYSMEQEGRNCVALEIIDSGGGMSQEVVYNIFNPFFSTRGKETGLGLAICHRIVTSHHGSIDVDNRPGQGVRFIVRLPQGQPQNALSSTEELLEEM